jgi:hypothetical protein
MLQSIPKYLKDGKHASSLGLVALIVLTGSASFGLGRLSALGEEHAPVRIEYATTTPPTVTPSVELVSSSTTATAPNTTSQSAAVAGNTKGNYVASKTGTAYHLPWCPGALRIKEENKVWFATKAEAEAAGYRPAGNCKGI